MTGALTIQKDSPNLVARDMNGSTERRKVWFGVANSGNFYIYDNTKNRAIIDYKLADTIPTFNGKLGAEKLTVTFGASSYTNKIYWAYKFGNWVYVNIRLTSPNAYGANQPIAKLTDGSGNVVVPLVDNSNTSQTQLLGGTNYPAVQANSNGFNIVTLGAISAGQNVQIYGIFMCA